MRRYSQTTITNVIEMIMHVSIVMDGVTQQVFAQKMTRIHVYAGHVNMCVKEEPISAERAFKNYMFNGIKFVEIFFTLQ